MTEQGISAEAREAIDILMYAAKRGVEHRLVKDLMRIISNYASVGSLYGTSRSIKLANKRMSKCAYQCLIKAENINQWHDLTTNEHPVPLKEMWDDLRKMACDWSPEVVHRYFEERAMVTILQTEDATLRSAGLRSLGGYERHAKVGIKTMTLEFPPKEQFKRVSSD